MKLLAIDTATEQCSVAVLNNDQVYARCVPTPRGHADMLLPMVQDVLAEAGCTLQQIEAIAFGRGPGSFTGVRIAIGAAQGMALALSVPVLPVSNLAAVAQQTASRLAPGARVLVCMDARMGEIYCGEFSLGADGLVSPAADERLLPPDQLQVAADAAGALPVLGLGTGFRAYPVLRERCAGMTIDGSALPHATEILHLAIRDFAAGRTIAPGQAQPVYLRDEVAHVKTL